MRTNPQLRIAESIRPSRHVWGIILAGGDGNRLLPLTRQIAGDDRPKQFCAVIGGETLLKQTQSRIAKAIAPEQILVVLNKKHEQFYASQTAEWPSSRLLIQPYNRGTTPAILYSLLRIHEIDPAAIVAFFPSDHHFSDDAALVSHVQSGLSAAAWHSQLVFLLGVVPEYPEEEYGWIEPGAQIGEPLSGSTFRVSRFWEKPTQAFAEALMKQGCLWNSFVMLGRVSAFLTLVKRAVPELLDAFSSVRQILSTAEYAGALFKLYEETAAHNFSHGVLSAYPSNLAVIRGDHLGWTDLGEPRRALSAIRRKGMNTAPALQTSGQMTTTGSA